MNSNKSSGNRLNMEPPFGGLTVSSLSIKLLWLTSSSHEKSDAGILKGLLSIKELGGGVNEEACFQVFDISLFISFFNCSTIFIIFDSRGAT